VPGTPFGVAYLSVPPLVSGQAIGSLVTGIGSLLVGTVVVCFGLAGASGGWGPLVSGAFALLAAFVGVAGIGLGLVSRRQIARSSGQLKGRGMATAGIACGASGVALTALAFVLSIVLVAGSSG
jgi:hypothetical protein